MSQSVLLFNGKAKVETHEHCVQEYCAYIIVTQ